MVDGRVAVVTGGGSGLGKGAAAALRRFGATVFILGRRKEALMEAGHEIGCGHFSCDVTDRAAVRTVLEEIVQLHGRLDVLVNAAGLNLRGPSLEFSDQDWDSVHAVNSKGSFIAATEAARLMSKTGGGKIINYCSYGSACGLPGSVAYASSKGGVRQMTKSLAIEFAPLNIQVNGIEPGWFETEMTEGLFSDPEWIGRTIARIPAGRTGKVGDLDGIVTLLASPLSNYMTGIMVPVDGGAQAV